MSGTEDLLDTVGEVLGEGLLGLTHSSGNLDDLVKLNVSSVLDVLLLLAVSDGLLEGTDDEGRRGGDNGNGSLTVLNRKLNGNAETLPVASSLGDVLTDLLGRLLEGEAKKVVEVSSTTPDKNYRSRHLFSHSSLSETGSIFPHSLLCIPSYPLQPNLTVNFECLSSP